MSTSMILQNNVKAYRESLGLSQRELAKMIGVSHNMIKKMELYESKVSSEHLPELAKAFGCTIDDLFAERKQEG